jgi:hypothetical protein
MRTKRPFRLWFGLLHLLCSVHLAWAAGATVRNLSVEVRVLSEPMPSASAQQSWSTTAPTTESDWQKILVAPGEKARFEMDNAQAWAWTGAAVRGNGAGSVDGVSQSLQWAHTVRSLECMVRWAGGRQPARLELSLRHAESGRDLAAGTAPDTRSAQVHTVVWVPLGEWFTVARSGPRPLVQPEGSYTSRSAEPGQAQLLQVRVLAPDR